LPFFHTVTHDQTTLEGLTGHVAFDQSDRANFTLDIVQSTLNSQLTKVAEYRSNGGIVDNFTDSPSSNDILDLELPKVTPNRDIESVLDEHEQRTMIKAPPSLSQAQIGSIRLVPANYQRISNKNPSLENKTYIVTSIIEEPFLMLRKQPPNQPKLTGNARFEGYCKDLADLIAAHLNINYKLKLVTDGKYGGRNDSLVGGFNGMVGELIRHEADMAIAPLTITSAREKVRQFSLSLFSSFPVPPSLKEQCKLGNKFKFWT
jgi:hypothetical protein